jgi:hypothetical protein
MPKIINPDTLQDFKTRNSPALITISKKLVVFNVPAVKMLAIKPGDYFALEIDKNRLYYRDSNASGFRCGDKNGKTNIVISQISGLLDMLITEMGITGAPKSLRFEIGPLDAGRRLLFTPDTEKQ